MFRTMKRYFRHYKGNLYEYLGEANHSETLEEMVIYQAQYGEHKIWVRPRLSSLLNFPVPFSL